MCSVSFSQVGFRLWQSSAQPFCSWLFKTFPSVMIFHNTHVSNYESNEPIREHEQGGKWHWVQNGPCCSMTSFASIPKGHTFCFFSIFFYTSCLFFFYCSFFPTHHLFIEHSQFSQHFECGSAVKNLPVNTGDGG